MSTLAVNGDGTLPYSRDATGRPVIQQAIIDAIVNAAGGNAVSSATVTLTHAQILGLVTTQIQLVAAPGAGYALDILRVQLVSHIASAPRIYTNIDAGSYFAFAYGPTGSFTGTDLGLYVSNITSNQALVEALIGSTDGVIFAGPGFDIENTNPGFGAQPPYEKNPTYLDNKALSFQLWNGSAGNLTGGHASNTLFVQTLYSVVALT